MKFFQGKIKKDEQEVLIASNWEEECKSSSAARAAQAEPPGSSSSSGLHDLPVRDGQSRSSLSCGITPSSSPTSRFLSSCLTCCFQSAQAKPIFAVHVWLLCGMCSLKSTSVETRHLHFKSIRTPLTVASVLFAYPESCPGLLGTGSCRSWMLAHQVSGTEEWTIETYFTLGIAVCSHKRQSNGLASGWNKASRKHLNFC